MISLTTQQESILASKTLRVWWLFDVVTDGGTTFRWSTQGLAAVVTGDPAPSWEAGIFWEAGVHWAGDLGEDYDFRVTEFSGITLRRPKQEAGLVAPSDCSFTVLVTDDLSWETGVAWESGVEWKATGGIVSLSDMVGASVMVSLYIGDKDTEPVPFRRWRFRVYRAEPGYGVIRCVCESWFSKFLRGSWPRTADPRDLFPDDTSSTDDNDAYCVPFVIGTAYVPLRSAYIAAGSQREYIIGPAGPTYTVAAVHSPKDYGSDTEWLSSGYTMTQASRTGADGNSYRTLRPIIADSNGDAAADAMGLWQGQGSTYMDMPCKFSRSDTAGLTNPAAALKAILIDMGVPAEGLGDISFADAAATFDTWGLTWNGGFWEQQDRQTVIANLLAACHATLSMEEQVELRVLSKTSQATIGPGQVMGDYSGPGSFSYESLGEVESDSMYGLWIQSGSPQDRTIKSLVAAKSTKDDPDSSALDLSLISDSQVMQKLVALHAQRALLAEAGITHRALPGALLALQPDDIVTMAGFHYGGTYPLILDALTIAKNLALSMEHTKLSDTLDDWGDLSPAAITPSTDDTSASTVFSTATAGASYA